MNFQYAVRSQAGVLIIRKLTEAGAREVAKKYASLGAVVTKECSLEAR